jgi:hypothetical protein
MTEFRHAHHNSGVLGIATRALERIVNWQQIEYDAEEGNAELLLEIEKMAYEALVKIALEQAKPEPPQF